MNKKWVVEFKPSAFKELSKLDKNIQEKIFKYFEKLSNNDLTPRAYGLQLQGKHKGLWRYRVSDYRIICEIQDNKLIILVLGVGHRKEIYSKY